MIIWHAQMSFINVGDINGYIKTNRMKSIKRSLWQFYRCALKCNGWMKILDGKWMNDRCYWWILFIPKAHGFKAQVAWGFFIVGTWLFVSWLGVINSKHTWNQQTWNCGLKLGMKALEYSNNLNFYRHDWLEWCPNLMLGIKKPML